MRRLRQILAGVAARVRRRPVRAAVLTAGTAGVAAVVAIPLSFGGGSGGAAANPPSAVRGAVTGTSRYPGGPIVPMKPVPAPWSGLRMNGRPPDDAGGMAALPWYDVVRGEKLTFTVTVTVPEHAQLDRFFFGVTVSGDATGTGPHGPIGMSPVLVTASHLAPGPHQFTAHWTVPRTTPMAGYAVAGAAYWPRGTKAEPGGEEGPIANLFVEPPGN